MVDTAKRLASLSTRPPTPPKESFERSLDTSSPNRYFAHITNNILLDTPNESPSSSVEYFAGSSEKGIKRVEFSPWLKLHDPVKAGGKVQVLEGDLRPLPPSRQCKFPKSILKPSTDLSTSSPMGEFTSFDGSDFPMMLQSVKAHLRSPSRLSRLDAYSALLGSLSAYDDLPDTNALVENLPEFLEHIRRDVSAKIGEKAILDTQLATQSLKLLTIFLCTPVVAESLPDDFRAYILDKSISSLEDVELPKIAVNHYMQVLAKQNFSGKHMTNERANRVLLAIKNIVERVKGNSTIGLRFRIYGRLLLQARQTLASNAAIWIDHLVSGMLSTTREVRSLAIAFGLDAGIALGTISSVSQACREMFDRKSPEGQTVAEFLTSRLNGMTTAKDDILHVPQIWSVLTLFLRNRPQLLAHWRHLKPWLLVLQKCLNSNDPSVKCLAMTAWNRLVMAINLDSSTSLHMIKMLRQPVETHLKRKGSDKITKQTRQLAHSSYCNLLYYAFRPSITHSQLDIYWGQYVDQMLPENFSASKRDTTQACAILAALLHASEPRPWDEIRANNARFVRPDELPCIDPKWTRSQAARIASVFEKLIGLADWTHSENEEAVIVRAWRSFTRALAEASKQEVKVSVQSMSAVAQILNMLTRYWDRMYVQRNEVTSTEFASALGKIRLMIEIAIKDIGVITFKEQRLLWNALNRFEATETPSSRSLKERGTLGSPVVHLLRLLVSTIKDSENPEAYTGVMRYLLGIALHPISSRPSQLAMLRDLTVSLISENSGGGKARAQLWQLLAQAAKEAMRNLRPKDGASENFHHVGREFRDAARILEIGIAHQSPISFEIWEDLYSAICESLRQEVGDGGIVIIITEPAAAAIDSKLAHGLSDFLLRCADSLIKTFARTYSAQDIERAKRLLWGPSATIQKPSALSHSDKINATMGRILAMAYASCAELRTSSVSVMIEALTDGLCSCPREAKIGMIRRLQPGIAMWVEDASGMLVASVLNTDLGRVSTAVRKFWAAAVSAIEQLPPNNTSLDSIQGLMISSLESRHRVIANDAISLWNRTFGSADHLEYPEALCMVLARLRRLTDIELPGFPELDDASIAFAPYHYVESQVTEEDKIGPITPSPAKAREVITIAHKTPMNHRRATQKFALEPSPSAKLSKVVKQSASRTPQKARSRHDDSQVQFAAVEVSSPLLPKDMASQIVTDHQRDIRERQSREVAMFPDLSSSPRLPSSVADRSLPRLVLSRSKNDHHPDIEHDTSISPVLPEADGIMESFLGSSPTPRSGMKRTVVWNSAADRCSSPLPFPSSIEECQKPAVAALVDEQKALENKELEYETLHQTRVLNGNKIPTLSEALQEPMETADQPTQVPAAVNNAAAPPAGVSSDVDVFVDASTEAPDHSAFVSDKVVEEGLNFIPPSVPDREREDEEPVTSQHNEGLRHPPSSTDIRAADDQTASCITDSFGSQISVYSNDEEQITAQLAADMERASSQAESARSKQKRRRSFHEPIGESKRPKLTPDAQNCHVVVEKQRPKEIDDDCIIIDTRVAIDSKDKHYSPIKRERSSSPTMSHSPAHALNIGESTTTSSPITELEITKPGYSASVDQPDVSQVLKQKPKQLRGTERSSNAEPLRRRSARLNGIQENTMSNHVSPIAGTSLSGDKEASSTNIQIPVTGTIKHGLDISEQSARDLHNHPNRVADSGQQLGTVETASNTSATAETTNTRSNREPLQISKPAAKSDSLGSRMREKPSLQQKQETDNRGMSAASGETIHPHHSTPERGLKPHGEETEPTSAGIMEGFRKLLGNIQHVKLKTEEERAMVGVLFECVKEVQEAGRRHSR